MGRFPHGLPSVMPLLFTQHKTTVRGLLGNVYAGLWKTPWILRFVSDLWVLSAKLHLLWRLFIIHCSSFLKPAWYSNLSQLSDIMGVRTNFSRWKANPTFYLSFSVCWRCNANGRTQKRKCPLLRQCFPSKKTLQWGNVSVIMEFFETELAEFEMNNELREFLESLQNLMKILKIYTFDSNTFSLFSYFSNDLECCKCARLDFTTQMVWWYCAFAQLWREHWLKKMRFVGSNASFSLMLLYTLYKPGVGKLVQWKSHLQKTKNTSEPQNQFVVSIQIW